MKKDEKSTEVVSEMRPEYDFSSGVRGKYASRLTEGSRIVVLDPDMAEIFKDSEAVNSALRAIVPSVPRSRRRKGSSKKEPTR